jgi:hypothetical protein
MNIEHKKQYMLRFDRLSPLNEDAYSLAEAAEEVAKKYTGEKNWEDMRFSDMETAENICVEMLELFAEKAKVYEQESSPPIYGWRRVSLTKEMDREIREALSYSGDLLRLPARFRTTEMNISPGRWGVCLEQTCDIQFIYKAPSEKTVEVDGLEYKRVDADIKLSSWYPGWKRKIFIEILEVTTYLFV